MSKFLNTYELVTYDKLRAVADNVGAHVFAKVRLVDVIPVNNSGISKEKFTFALLAHVDFLVTNSAQEPQFCVEFDGPTHREKKQMRRDGIKNELFERFNMPYLRINSRYLEERYRGLDLLTYFVDVWFLAIAFDEAQAAGHIPDDEVFDPASFVSSRTPGGPQWPYWLSLGLQVKIEKLYESKRVAQRCAGHWVGADKLKTLRCVSWLRVTETGCLFVETGMRKHRFPAVYCSELVSQLALFDLYDALILALNGQKKLTPISELDARINFYKTNYEMRAAFSG